MQRRKNLAALVEGLEFRRLLATITVTSTADTVTPDDGAVTLREAITAINAGNDLSDPDITAQTPGTFGKNDAIKFAIGTGPATIVLSDQLPVINVRVDLDATTQPGWTSRPIVTLDATAVPDTGDEKAGLWAEVPVTIRGFVIENCVATNPLNTVAAGIVISDTGNFGVESVIAGNDLIDNGDGIAVQSDNDGYLVGGTTLADRNVISGNQFNGLGVTSGLTSNSRIEGNYIGVAEDGTTAMGNGGDGIQNFAASGTNPGTTFVGGSTPAAGNIIANNGGFGITQLALGFARLNSIYANGKLGITKGGNMPLPNDPQDADQSGSSGILISNLQNYPVLASATKNADGSLTITGLINSNPSTPLLLDFYGNDAQDPSGYGQGKTYLATVPVTTDGSGNAAFTVTVPASIAASAGTYISSTATSVIDSNLSETSEFSADVQIQIAAPPPPPLPTLSIGDVALSEGNSGTTAFTFTVSRSGDLSGSSSVAIAAADGTATVADGDYLPNATILTFNPNDTTKTFTVSVNGDKKVEANETFTVNLSTATGVTIADAQATGTIVNDDVAPPPPPSTGTVTIVTDPIDHTKTALDITGTNNGDTITVTKSGSSQGKATVKINGVNKGTFSFSGSILVYGKDGNDNISIDSAITRSAWIWGGDNNDTVNGGGGNDFVFGQAGNDSLNGNAGRDILIGGDGTDKLNGGSGDDVLIAGDFKTTPTMSQLSSIQKEWTRTDKNYTYRVSHLTNGGGYNTIQLNSSTLFSSTTLKDSLTGGTDSDLFFAAMNGDKIMDKSSSETAVNIG